MMSEERLTDQEIEVLLDRMFPNGFAGPDVKDILSPKGWEHSPLMLAFHPTAEQRYREHVQFKQNLARLSKSNDKQEIVSFEEFKKQEYRERPVEPEKELWELVGLCVWDIFSDNHEVKAPDGRIADMGSMRGAAGFIAEWIDARVEDIGKHDYLDFYMGTAFVSGRADLSQVYRMIFQRFKQTECDWAYHFPQLYVLDMSEPEDPENYDPAEAIASEHEKDQLKETIEQANKEAVEEAREKGPPTTVKTYKEVFGCFPKGWPPENG